MPQGMSPRIISDQRALQWWNQRQLDRQHQSAERIRDGLLQDLFAIRRSLEVTQHSSPTGSHLTQVMTQLDTLHLGLETLSNHLSPPFAHDHFNLAIQHYLQQWQQEHPTVSLVFSLTSMTPIECNGISLNHHLALMSITEWLDIITPLLSDAAEVKVMLQAQDNAYPCGQDPPDHGVVLTLAIKEPKGQQRNAIAQQPSLGFLCHAFRLLSGGQVMDNIHQDKPWMQWQFCWSSP